MQRFDFKPGDRVEYCGDEAVVIANHGSTGTVEIPGEGRMTWYWNFQGTAVTLVARGERRCST
jgi:hypothetical protein